MTPSNNIYKFTITKRGSLSKIFGVNKGLLNTLHDDFNITATNSSQIQFLFSDQVFQKLELLFRSAISLDVNSQSGLMVIEIEMGYNNTRLFNAINFVEFLLPKLISSNILEGIEFEEYTCFSCKSEIPYFGDYCTNCGVVAPKCVICFDDPEPDEIEILYDCCKSYAHQDHALTWKQEDNICPSCRSDSPELIPIKEIEV